VNRSPCWSPDGSRIAYTSERPGFYELFLYDLESGCERQVTSAGHDLDNLAWSPDGTRLLYTANRSGAFDLGIVDLGSGELQVVRREYGFHARPAWLPGGKDITFEYEDPRRPPDIFRMDLDTRQVTQLTFSLPPALAALDLAIPEQVSVSSFDGLEIPSFLYSPARPNGASIVYPHGGPTAQYTLEWDIWAQYLTAKGYTVLAPNYRGSSGYGMDFERLNYDVWGVDDTRDCLAAADYLVEARGVDPKRIAICGASYGSYLVVCSLAFDPLHRFACGVAKYGDCNLLTSWAACDRSGQEDLYRMMGHPSTHRAGYKAGSPVWQVENIQAPLLILHGLLDPYVPPTQSEELVEALHKAGKTYEYKTYPDEGHGFMRRKNQLDFYERMERFIDWYLL
jgi:dipeptidyl aminopeptidase/acylaminoacyl peptidase